ncbi:MAG: MOSC domain-containing protein [Dehalococcoidia bacterium]|nr:MOSC domain-containing protein [Dehalococcoidia bacterium]
MPVISAIHATPVKSLGLSRLESAVITHRGIANDRRFLLMDPEGRVVTQRQLGKLTQVSADYSEEEESLCMTFPDGSTVSGQPGSGGETATVLWGRVVRGEEVEGEWSKALSDFCGVDLTLMKSRNAGESFDEYPVSLISEATVSYLSSLTGGKKEFEVERFRPTLLLSGCEPHEEDSWLGKGLILGDRLRLRLISRDPRCAITTLDPKTGERDFDTLRLILSYRPSRRAAYLGVYGIVEASGSVSVGDEIVLSR